MMVRFASVSAFICLSRSEKEHCHCSFDCTDLSGFLEWINRAEKKTTNGRRRHSLHDFAPALRVRHAFSTYDEVRSQIRRLFQICSALLRFALLLWLQHDSFVFADEYIDFFTSSEGKMTSILLCWKQREHGG